MEKITEEQFKYIKQSFCDLLYNCFPRNDGEGTACDAIKLIEDSTFESRVSEEDRK